MAIKSKFFRVATAGATTDGRTIEREQIQEMADTFNPATYGARVWLEHIRGIMPDSQFKAYGDVVAVKAEEVDTAEGKRLALFAQIEPTPELVAINKARQKIYTSVEINPKFADSGKAYLIGLGVTDSPASLGTEALTFAAGRKLHKDNVFTAAQEVEIEFEDEGPSLADQFKSMFARITGSEKKGEAQQAEITAGMTAIAEGVAKFAGEAATANKAVVELTARIEKMEKRQVEEADEALKFRQSVNLTDKDNNTRPPATGGNNSGAVQTEF